jgi:hypothetical protein
MRLSLKPKSLTDVNSKAVEGSNDDRLSFAYILSKYGQVGTFNISGASSAMTVLASIPVTPYLYNDSVTPIGMVASLFDKWTGDLEFVIYISSTPFVKGRIGINWQTNSNTINSGTLNGVPNLIVDLGGSVEVHLVVPWGHKTPAISAVSTAYKPANFPSLSANSGWDVNGYVNVYVVDPLVANTAVVPTLTAVVFIKAGPNFRVFDPSMRIANQFYAVSANFQEGAKRIDFAFNGSNIPDDVILGMSGGELESSLRPLTHRKMLAMVQQPFGGITYVSPMLHTPLYEFYIWPNIQSVGSAIYPLNTVLGVIASCFSTWSGSLRHTVQCGTTASNSTGVWTTGMNCITASRFCRNHAGGTPSPYYYNTATGTRPEDIYVYNDEATGSELSVGAVSAAPNIVSIEVPYVCDTLACPFSSNNGAQVPGAQISVQGFNGQAQLFQLLDYQSAGDDFQVHEWVGGPVLTYAAQSYTNWTVG